MQKNPQTHNKHMFVLLVVIVACLSVAAIYDRQKQQSVIAKEVAKSHEYQRQVKEIMARVGSKKSISQPDLSKLTQMATGSDVGASTLAMTVLSSFCGQKIITFEQYSSVFVTKMATCLAPETVLISAGLAEVLNLAVPSFEELFQPSMIDAISLRDQTRITKVANSTDPDARRAIAIEIFARLRKGDAEVGWARGLIQECASKATGADKSFWSTMSKAFDRRFGS